MAHAVQAAQLEAKFRCRKSTNLIVIFIATMRDESEKKVDKKNCWKEQRKSERGREKKEKECELV